MTRTLLLVIVIVAAALSPASAMSSSPDIALHASIGGCTANMSTASCTLGVAHTAAHAGPGTQCRVSEGTLVCTQTG